MKITNHNNLPDTIYRYLSKSNYVAGNNHYSVTTLLNPPQVVQLKKRYFNELESDCLDLIWSVFGSGVHNILEGCSSPAAMVERRFYKTVLKKRIGGQIDHYENETITDYKVTSASTLVYGSRIEEWEEQQNIYAHLMKQNGYEVSKLQICAILRDWDKHKAKVQSDYPKAPVVVLELELWDDAYTADFLRDKVALHVKNEKVQDHALTPCSESDQWRTKTKYAVMKNNNKRATKVFDDVVDAEWFISGLICDNAKDNYYIEERLGRRIRCEDYCPVKAHCKQYIEELGDE